MIKQCLYCGVVFETNRNKQKYCCYEHKERARYKPIIHSIKTCVSCGKEFIPKRSTKIYCSKRCCDKECSKVSHRLREANARKNGKVDHTITLLKLIERDEGVCKICGGLVDDTDYTYVNDTFVAGNFYPSIDHIIPLSKRWNTSMGKCTTSS